MLSPFSPYSNFSPSPFSSHPNFPIVSLEGQYHSTLTLNAFHPIHIFYLHPFFSHPNLPIVSLEGQCHPSVTLKVMHSSCSPSPFFSHPNFPIVSFGRSVSPLYHPGGYAFTLFNLSSHPSYLLSVYPGNVT